MRRNLWIEILSTTGTLPTTLAIVAGWRRGEHAIKSIVATIRPGNCVALLLDITVKIVVSACARVGPTEWGWHHIRGKLGPRRLLKPKGRLPRAAVPRIDAQATNNATFDRFD